MLGTGIINVKLSLGGGSLYPSATEGSYAKLDDYIFEAIRKKVSHFTWLEDSKLRASD